MLLTLSTLAAREVGVHLMVFDPDDNGLSTAKAEEFAKMVDEAVRSFDANGDGVISRSVSVSKSRGSSPEAPI